MCNKLIGLGEHSFYTYLQENTFYCISNLALSSAEEEKSLYEKIVEKEDGYKNNTRNKQGNFDQNAHFGDKYRV